jgi:hypothetical protein
LGSLAVTLPFGPDDDCEARILLGHLPLLVEDILSQ